MTAGRRRAEGRTDPPQPSRPGLVPCCVLSLGGSATGPFPHRPPQSTRPSREQEGGHGQSWGSGWRLDADDRGRSRGASSRALTGRESAQTPVACSETPSRGEVGGGPVPSWGLGPGDRLGRPCSLRGTGPPSRSASVPRRPPGERERTVRSRPAGHTRGVALPSVARESRRRELAGLLFWL